MIHQVVATENGSIRGKTEISPSGKEYFSFQGIPYAKPPVGKLRFKPPESVDKWNGILDATKQSQSCLQKPLPHTLHQKLNLGLIGSEDCLYLNVYSTALTENQPVMVFFHGGTFNRGNGGPELFGPQLLMERDVVLVTLNFRLEAFGFLNLNIPECSGNMGLKDQVVALKWIKENIKHFGGNADNVTIFGVSTGAICVSLLLISPLSKGLYHKAIIQSGPSTVKWCFLTRTKAKEYAFALARNLGFTNEDPIEIHKLFMSLPADELADATTKIKKELKLIGDDLVMLPTIEIETDTHPFITKEPREYLINGEFADVPIITGVVSTEGFIYLPIVVERKDDLVSNPSQIIANFDVNRVDLNKKLEEVYDFKDTFKALTDIKMDDYQLYPTIELFEILRKFNRSPIYLYCFDYKSERDFLRFMMLHRCRLLDGVLNGTCHADEQMYLFQPEFREYPENGTKTAKVIKNMTKLWTNFAFSSNPNSKDLDVYWPESFADQYNFLLIRDELSVVPELFKERIEFWKRITKN